MTSPIPTALTATEDADCACSIGSFERDTKTGGYTLIWEDIRAMEIWMAKEINKKCIEFSKKTNILPSSPEVSKIWTSKTVYVCSRGHSGGKSKYSKKHDWNRAVPGKKLESGCPCSLTVKTYPNTNQVAGNYVDNHSHATGNINTHFTHLQKETWDEIECLLRLGVDPHKVVSTLSTI